KLPLSDKDTGDGNSVYVYQRQDKIELLKLLVYEKFRSEWNLNLDNGLKEEFISKINLKPIVTVVKTDKIDWFEYKVEYKIHNVTLSHQEIRSFFGKNEKYLRLPDNRLVHFEDNKAFSQLDNFLKTIEKSGGAKNRLQNYNLTYLFALSKINTNLQVAGDDYLNVMFNDLLRRRAEDITSVPLSLTNVMRSYQKLGYYWLKMLQRHHLGGILADDMGLGKTLQALALLSDFYQENKETHKMSLVVCPKTLLFNWGAEIDKFHPNLTYTIYEGNKSSRSDILEECTSDIVIVSYSLVQTDIDIFKEYSFAYIILDEAQHIKNPATLKSKGVKRLEAEHRVALTGTPMENNAVELWSIFDFLMPGYLQSLRTFKKTYDDDDLTSKEEQVRRKELLAQVISPFILRRRKSEVLLELPDKQTQLIYNKMTAQQERLYLKVLNTVKESLMPAEETDKPINYINVLTILMRLRQICNHPGMIDSTLMDKINYSAKLESLVSLIQDAVENRRKLLVFSQFTSMLKIVSESLDKIGITYEYMDGKTVDRKERIERFTTDEQIRVFLLTLKVGGLGLNLTAADTVILVDPWWNPMSEDQSIDRVYRIGQTKKVLVYKLVTKGTIEEKILQLQDKKRTYFENIVENSQSFINKLTINDLKELFEYEPQLI
ncbi:MAG: DEAD/DEAH box helicase, partial [Candidatus Cloacimonas sp.]|nr:DEAD/DEAH box helicase [Candidatus Cloacimonadota bacterium]